MTTREHHLVELVDVEGRAVGSASVAEAHRSPGNLHRAFSVVVVDAAGRTLLQQRAAEKTRFPLRWANACCGHPAPGEAVEVAAARRLVEEIGMRDVPLREVGVYAYRADDPATGRVELEYDHVLLGQVDGEPALRSDPAEVAAVRWITLAELRTDLDANPSSYAPWLAGVISRLPGGVSGAPTDPTTEPPERTRA